MIHINNKYKENICENWHEYFNSKQKHQKYYYWLRSYYYYLILKYKYILYYIKLITLDKKECVYNCNCEREIKLFNTLHISTDVCWSELHQLFYVVYEKLKVKDARSWKENINAYTHFHTKYTHWLFYTFLRLFVRRNCPRLTKRTNWDGNGFDKIENYCNRCDF